MNNIQLNEEESDIVLIALYHYQLICSDKKDMKVVLDAINTLIDKITINEDNDTNLDTPKPIKSMIFNAKFKDNDPEFVKIVDDNFWDLFDENKQ